MFPNIFLLKTHCSAVTLASSQCSAEFCMENVWNRKHFSKSICEGYLFNKEIKTVGPGHNFSSSCCTWDQLFESELPLPHLRLFFFTRLNLFTVQEPSVMEEKAYVRKENYNTAYTNYISYWSSQIKCKADTSVKRAFPVSAIKPQVTWACAGDCPASRRRLDRWLPESPCNKAFMAI